MSDIIKLLPDSIANQIAAGEVVQRPASVVKELLENAIDAGATRIQMVIKDAGKTLIQVIDDGSGMSPTDARLCFERHATSKIKSSEDLFSIKTMGFRGEAMASIAAIAHVELKTRRQDDELGTTITIEASEITKQEPCQATTGTSISVKNLFYNVPARRNFLKTNPVEMRHILDEFQRVALANPEVFFSLHHNNMELFHLPAAKLRQRIVGILGNNTNKKLVPVQEETDILKLYGFVGKPEFAKKTRGDQYFFVNNRFIKSGYLHHAIVNAYEDLLPKGQFPLYVIFIEIDPKSIDINVHPTKQEIKFVDERLVYNYLRVTVRHALGQYSITPVLDFDQETSFQFQQEQSPVQESTQFEKKSSKSSFYSPKEKTEREISNLNNWESLYSGLGDAKEDTLANNDDEESEEEFRVESNWNDTTPLDDEAGSFSKQQKKPYQIHSRYIVSHIKSGFLLIDQQLAHERILYETYLSAFQQQNPLTQKQLFPSTLELSVQDAEIMKSILPDVNALGFEISEFGSNTFVIHGIPADLESVNEVNLVESLLEQYKLNIDLEVDVRDNLARSMARSAAIKRGQDLSIEVMQELIDQLFACEVPYQSPYGKKCFATIQLDELERKFL